MRFFSTLCSVTLAVSALALPTSDHVIHEKRSGTPSKWEKIGRVNGTEHVLVRIGLTQSNLDRAYEYLMSVYVDPLPHEIFRLTSQVRFCVA